MSCFRLSYKVNRKHYSKIIIKTKGVLFIDWIVDHCVVMSLENYEKHIDSPEDRLFFMRASYNTKTEKFNPPPNEWPKICICGMPSNPELSYIYCDICKKWLHMACVKITADDAT